MLGDFNIHDTTGDLAMNALVGNGLEVPDNIKGVIDQHRQRRGSVSTRLRFGSTNKRFEQGAGGVIDFRRLIYRRQDSEFYRNTVKVQKLTAQAAKLPEKSKEHAKEAKELAKEARVLRERAQAQPAQAEKLIKSASKLEAKAKKGAAQAERESKVPESVADYMVDYYRKNQISDHLLLWALFKIDYANSYLEELASDDS